MPSYCAIASCKSCSKHGTGIHYYRFPKDPKINKIWIRKCKRGDKINVNYARICSNHFKEEDFVRDLKSELLGLKRIPKLKISAVPNINLTPEKTLTPREARTVALKTQKSVERATRHVKRVVRKSALELLSKPSMEQNRTVSCDNSDAECDDPDETSQRNENTLVLELPEHSFMVSNTPLNIAVNPTSDTHVLPDGEKCAKQRKVDTPNISISTPFEYSTLSLPQMSTSLGSFSQCRVLSTAIDINNIQEQNASFTMPVVQIVNTVSNDRDGVAVKLEQPIEGPFTSFLSNTTTISNLNEALQNVPDNSKVKVVIIKKNSNAEVSESSATTLSKLNSSLSNLHPVNAIDMDALNDSDTPSTDSDMVDDECDEIPMEKINSKYLSLNVHNNEHVKSNIPVTPFSSTLESPTSMIQIPSNIRIPINAPIQPSNSTNSTQFNYKKTAVLEHYKQENDWLRKTLSDIKLAQLHTNRKLRREIVKNQKKVGKIMKLKDENKALVAELTVYKNQKLKYAHSLKQENKYGSISKECYESMHTLLKPYFTHGQIECLITNRQKKEWPKEDILRAMALRKISTKAYMYIRKVLKIPFPGLNTLRRWERKEKLENEKCDAVNGIVNEIDSTVDILFDETATALLYIQDEPQMVIEVETEV